MWDKPKKKELVLQHKQFNCYRQPHLLIFLSKRILNKSRLYFKDWVEIRLHEVYYYHRAIKDEQIKSIISIDIRLLRCDYCDDDKYLLHN